VAAPVFFPSASKGDECWWGTKDLNTVYLWDIMDNEDRQDSLEVLREKDNWVIWKTKDTKWTQDLQRAGFHQMLGEISRKRTSEEAKDIKETLMAPGQNYGKDRYTIDLTGTEATYWLGTESDLLGAESTYTYPVA
jgi:hypothetical protein